MEPRRGAEMVWVCGKNRKEENEFECISVRLRSE